LALPVPDTLKRSDASAEAVRSVQTVDRAGLWAAQTPQLFPLHRLAHALKQATDVTDEASAMEQLGAKPRLVMGDWANRKYTYPEDFQEREALTRQNPWPRVGTGFDVHALVEGRPLIIGGVRIDHPRGLLGHSDADVLLHAISDAILGAAGLGDIGRHFPDTESQYKGADSRVLLRTVVERVHAEGFDVYQLDATIIAQAPKMSPHIAQMVMNIQADTQTEAVNIKATTTEHLGFTGRQEGIAAQASAVLVPRA
jgi:2-C-methyl-D-erythritol 2,4-cyclodiphosphate synthase